MPATPRPSPTPPAFDDLQLRAWRAPRPLTDAYPLDQSWIQDPVSIIVEATSQGQTGFGEGILIPELGGTEPDDGQARLAAWLERWDGDLAGGLSPAALPELPAGPRAAVEGALTDLTARLNGCPVAELLAGGSIQEWGYSLSTTLPTTDHDDLSDQVETWLDRGQRVFKLTGGRDPDQLLDRVTLVREIAGRGLEIRVDANGAWDLDTALELLPDLEALDLAMLEQPLPADDLEGHAELRQATSLPIVLDESIRDPRSLVAALDQGAMDTVNLQLSRLGGTSRGVALANLCEEAGVTCMIGSWFESRIGSLHAAHLACAHPNIEHVELDGLFFHTEDRVTGGGRLDGTILSLGDGPGLGIEAVDHASEPFASGPSPS